LRRLFQREVHLLSQCFVDRTCYLAVNDVVCRLLLAVAFTATAA
jgi:hypothetical protein